MTFFLSLIMGQVISLIEKSASNTENLNPWALKNAPRVYTIATNQLQRAKNMHTNDKEENASFLIICIKIHSFLIFVVIL